MTRSEFDGGWKILKGAGLPWQHEPEGGVFYSMLRDMPATTWGEVVRRAVSRLKFFPTPVVLRDLADEAMRDAEIARRDALGLPAGPPDPRERVTFLRGRSDFPKLPNESFVDYLKRLSDSGIIDDGSEESAETLAARMRADAARAPESWVE